MIILVAGPRTFTDKALMWQNLALLISPDDTIIHGNANGADKMAGDYAKEFGIACEPYKASWAFGLVGGHSRNQIMAHKADKAIIFWDGFSTGTADMIARIKYEGKEVQIIYYKVEQNDKS